MGDVSVLVLALALALWLIPVQGRAGEAPGVAQGAEQCTTCDARQAAKQRLREARKAADLVPPPESGTHAPGPGEAAAGAAREGAKE